MCEALNMKILYTTITFDLKIPYEEYFSEIKLFNGISDKKYS